MKSMTGFGRAEVSIEQHSFTIEVKSVNHRYMEVGIKLPRKLSFMEEGIKNVGKRHLQRGRLDIYINQHITETSTKKVTIDQALCKSYQDAFNDISQFLGIENDLNMSLLANLPDVVTIEQQDVDEKLLAKRLEEGLGEALAQLVQMRKTEGESLRKDLEERIQNLRGLMGEIEIFVPKIANAYRERLIKRIADLTNNALAVDENRLLAEVAIIAEKSSVEEEIVRFNSHLDQFIATMGHGETVGRKLDFLAQELNREINTIGSKVGDIQIGSRVVDVKSEMEKIREQVQNIE